MEKIVPLGIYADRVLREAEKYIGTPYRFGSEVKGGGTVVKSLDCSEFVELVMNRLGYEAMVGESFPDLAARQYDHCAAHGEEIGVDEAFRRDGCLVFMRNRVGKVHHVGFTATGFTVEARGREYGTSKWPRRPGWKHGFMIPHVIYKGG